MSNTKAGGKKVSKTIKEKYGVTADGKSIYHIQLGSKGGKAPTSKPKGFAAMPREKVSAAGAVGGSRSKRGPAKKTPSVAHTWDEVKTPKGSFFKRHFVKSRGSVDNV